MVSAWVVGHTRHPLALLAAIVVVSGALSAFFVNDTMCLVLTPLVLDIAVRLRRNPVPYLLAVAMAANIGSAATITGNPQNMLIGTFSRIPYREFAEAIAPVAAVGLVLTFVLIAAVYRREFFGVPRIEIEKRRIRVHRALLVEVGDGGRCDDHPVLRRAAGPERRVRRRGVSPRHPARQAGKSLPGDRLVPSRAVRRPVRGHRRRGENPAHRYRPSSDACGWTGPAC